jgi:uncharacterized protein YutE (UPF0331/DUF86 family)
MDAINLVEASINNVKPYNIDYDYTPEEREPYDALSDRFIRAVETSLKFFRSYEKLMFAENSETLRDLLNRMEKLKLISSVTKWMEMRDIRNRIVHDYLPEDLKEIYDTITGDFGKELIKLKKKIKKYTFGNAHK